MVKLTFSVQVMHCLNEMRSRMVINNAGGSLGLVPTYSTRVFTTEMQLEREVFLLDAFWSSQHGEDGVFDSD